MEYIYSSSPQLHNPLGSEPAQKSRRTKLMSAFSLSFALKALQSEVCIFSDTIGKSRVFGKTGTKVMGSKSPQVDLTLKLHLAKGQKCSPLPILIDFIQTNPTSIWRLDLRQQRLPLPKGQVWHFHPKNRKFPTSVCSMHLEVWIVLQSCSLLWPAEMKGFAWN